MATIKEVIETIDDAEVQKWFTDFFIRHHTADSLSADPEAWYSMLGCEIKKVSPITYDNGYKSYKAWEAADGAVYVGSFGSYVSTRRELVALYGLVSKLGHRPHWYEEY
jgi:hypothetical protein